LWVFLLFGKVEGAKPSEADLFRLKDLLALANETPKDSLLGIGAALVEVNCTISLPSSSSSRSFSSREKTERTSEGLGGIADIDQWRFAKDEGTLF
jgi:hypothetical protein